MQKIIAIFCSLIILSFVSAEEPAGWEALMQEASDLVQQQEFDKAVEKYHEALKTCPEPKLAELFLQLSKCYYFLEKWDLALKTINRSLENTKEASVESYILKLNILARSKKYDQLGPFYEVVLDKVKNDPQMYFDVLIFKGAFYIAVRLDVPKGSDILIAIVRDAGKNEAACVEVLRVFKNLAYFFQDNGKEDKFIEVLDKANECADIALEAVPTVSIYRLKIEFLISLKELAEVEKVYEKVLEAFKLEKDVRVELLAECAEFYLGEKDDLNKACQILDKLIEEISNKAQGGLIAYGKLQQDVDAWHQLGELEKAKVLMEKAFGFVEKIPKDGLEKKVLLSVNRAYISSCQRMYNILMRQNKGAEAYPWLEKGFANLVSQVAEGTVSASEGLTACAKELYAVKEKSGKKEEGEAKIGEAISAVDKAIVKNPDSPELYFRKGELLLILKKYNEVVTVWEECLKRESMEQNKIFVQKKINEVKAQIPSPK